MGNKVLGYFKLKGLKVLVGHEVPSKEKNELAFTELIQYLDKRSLALLIGDVKENG